MSQFVDYQSLSMSPDQDTQEIIAMLLKLAEDAGLTVVDVDNNRPWGGFVRFDTKDSEIFGTQFFKNVAVSTTDHDGKALPLSPKFLLVAPRQRLSWQRHQRRSEVWKFLTDGGAYSQSMDPDKQPIISANKGDVVAIERGNCHRLISQSDSFVLVAEIWQHTDLQHLSNEEDNERLQDDYNRQNLA